MPFSLICPHRDCQKLQVPYLDPETQLVYCSLCDKELPNITPFVKHQMKMNKQFRHKSKEKKKAFELKCPLCQAEVQPKLIEDQVVCGKCEQPMSHLTSFYSNMLKTQLANQQKTDKDDE